MTPNDIEKLGKLLSQFLDKFSDCFARPAGRRLLLIYVSGLLSDVQRRNAEAIALQQNVPPRTLQRFLESMVWDEQLLRDRCWRKTHTDDLASNQCALIVARNVLTNETKFFLPNRVPGRDGWTLRKLLHVAFERWPIEDCFREAKEEFGFDHFECRGYRCILRQPLSPAEGVLSGELLTMEQVQKAAAVHVRCSHLSPRIRRKIYRAECIRQAYYDARNALRPVTRTGRLDGNNWQSLGLILKRSNLFHPGMLTESFNLALSK